MLTVAWLTLKTALVVTAIILLLVVITRNEPELPSKDKSS